MAAKGGLMKNPYSWTHAGVNFLALESPVGVGFSYCSNSIEKNATCFADDQSTAKMNKAALIDFFNNKFPELEGGDFYVSGEFLTRTFVFQIRDGWIPRCLTADTGRTGPAPVPVLLIWLWPPPPSSNPTDGSRDGTRLALLPLQMVVVVAWS